MPTIDLLIPFFAATVIFAATPGPGMLYMTAQTLTHGNRAEWLSSVAFYLASYLHISAAAFGVTVLLAAAPMLLSALKMIGGAYLIWMCLRLWRHPSAERAVADQSSGGHSARQAFRDSMVVEVLNPKSALFYVAFLPQFTSSDAAWPILCRSSSSARLRISHLVCLTSYASCWRAKWRRAPARLTGYRLSDAGSAVRSCSDWGANRLPMRVDGLSLTPTTGLRAEERWMRTRSRPVAHEQSPWLTLPVNWCGEGLCWWAGSQSTER